MRRQEPKISVSIQLKNILSEAVNDIRDAIRYTECGIRYDIHNSTGV